MKIHWLQHVPFEGLGAIEPWLLARGHTLSRTRFYAGETAPADAADFDWLIVMGGPMNIYEYRTHPWLRAESRLIAQAAAAGRRVLGVCLGAQLIADALGGKVFQNAEREIGWFPVTPAPGAQVDASPFAFPAATTVLHWHGDTFSLPPDARWLAQSEACAHQAFSVGPRVLGLQFHLEMTAADIAQIAQGCADELAPARYVQSAETLIAGAKVNAPPAAELLDRLLTALERG